MPEASDRSAYFAPASHIGQQGAAQAVLGPLQDDEALLIYSLVQSSHVRRVLEIGGLGGFSALTFLQGMHRKQPNMTVYTIDIHKVPRRHARHRVLTKVCSLSHTTRVLSLSALVHRGAGSGPRLTADRPPAC
jgi:Predicted O-methyltransferase